MVLHTMINIHKFDNAVIITSDGDFYCLVEYLVNKSKLQKLITTNPKYSSLLKKYAEYILPIDKLKGSLQKK